MIYEEKDVYLERALVEIREAELTPYEFRQRRLKREKDEKERLAKEKAEALAIEAETKL